jgi:hypothetical protein
LHLFIEGIKEDMRTGLVDEYGWTPTGHMLADSLTKYMTDKLVCQWIDTNRWIPSGYELLLRRDLKPQLGEADKVETFWCCSPGCPNCVNAVAEELRVSKILGKDGPAVFFGTWVKEQHAEGTPVSEESASNSVLLPSAAQVALAMIYLDLAGQL